MSLAKKVFRSAAWFQIAKLAQSGSSVAVTLVLARLLSPEVFGLAGLVTLYVIVLEQLAMVGVTVGIVQRKEIDQLQLSSAFWINVAFGVLTAGLIVLTAPLAARYYGQPELARMVPLLAINPLVVSLYQVNRRLLERHMRFGRIAVAEVASSVASGAVGVTLAVLGYGVYSLLWQSIANILVQGALTVAASRWRPDLRFSYASVRELFFFSLKVKASYSATFFGRNVDYLILSQVFSPALYGLYTLAFRVLFFPVRKLGVVFHHVTLPAYASIQNQPAKIRAGVLRSTSLVLMGLLPLPVVLAFYAGPLIRLTLGEAWLPLEDVLYLFLVAGVIQTAGGVSASVYPAVNRPGLLAFRETVKIVATGAAVLAGAGGGLLGVAIGLIASSALLMAFDLASLNRLVGLEASDVGRSVVGPLFAGAVMAAVFALLQRGGLADEGPVLLAAALLAGVASYALALWALNRDDLRYYYRLAFRP